MIDDLIEDNLPIQEEVIFIDEPSKLLPRYGNNKIHDTLTDECKQSLINDLLQESYIRIFINGAPGMGEEKVAVNIYKYLRNINFSGFIQIVCSDKDITDATTLLSMSLETDKHMELIPLTRYIEKRNVIPHCKIAFANSMLPLGIKNADLNADAIIQINANPINPNFSLIHHGIDLKNFDFKYLIAEQEYYNGVGIIPPVINEPLYENYPLTNKEQIIKTLFDVSQDTYFVSIYGLNEIFIQKGNCNPAVIIDNLRRAYQTVLINQKVVFLLFNEFKTDTLMSIVNKLEQAEDAKTRFLNINEDLHTQSILEELTKQTVNRVILYLGATESSIFDSLVNKSKVFIAEGKSAQSLAMGAGVPFLHSSSRGKKYSIPFYTLASKKIQTILANTSDALAFGCNEDDIAILANYLQQLTDSTSEIAMFYQKIHEQALDMNPLLHGLQIINSSKHSMCLLGKEQTSLPNLIQNRINLAINHRPTLAIPGCNSYIWQASKRDNTAVISFLAYNFHKGDEKVGELVLENGASVCRKSNGQSNVLKQEGVFAKMLFNLANAVPCKSIETENDVIGDKDTEQSHTSKVSSSPAHTIAPVFLPISTRNHLSSISKGTGLLLAGSSATFFGERSFNMENTMPTVSYDPYLLGTLLITSGIICLTLLCFLINYNSTNDNGLSLSLSRGKR